MEPQTLASEIRQDKGKSAARQLRAQGRIPAVFYGSGTDPVSLSVTPKELAARLSTAHGRNVLLKLEVGGKEHLAMVKELQVHPVSREILHADLYRVELSQKVRVEVPLTTKGRAKGVVAGGELTVVYRTLPVRSTPDKIPAVIEVDVGPMQINEFVKTKDLPLDEGVEVTLDPERNLITLLAPRKRLATEADEGAAAEGAGAGAAPAKGAPGKGGKG